MSFTLRPFASAALLLSMAGLCAGTLLAAEQTEPSEASAVRARPLVLGVVETAEPSFDDNTVRPVLKAMQSAAPGTQIDVVRLSSATFEVAVAQLKPDLVISPAADFLRIVDSIGAHPIGTRKTKYAKHPSKSAGGAVIALASRTDIQKLTDLRGKYIAATLPTSVDGMLAVRMELAERGFDNRQFFRSVRYLGYSMPNVIESVLSGHFDAGVVPVCTLERIEAEDLIERGALRVISPKSDDDTVCAHTSERPVDPLLLRALAGAEGEAHRIAAIVDRVRSYARRQHADPVPVDIVREAQNALRSLKAELRPFVVIRPPFSLSADDASKRRLIMRGDPLEIELLLLNVMKNAAEAVQGLPDGAVLVKFRRETLPSPLAENPSPSPAAPSAEAVIVEVEDNGPRLSDEAFERLTRVSQSVKDEGLGLGLGIVRSLVEENGGRIAITRREDLSGRGLRVTLCFDLDAEGLKAQSAPHTDPADKSAAQAFQRSHEPAAKTAK